jgi:RHS repeat-associated protein
VDFLLRSSQSKHPSRMLAVRNSNSLAGPVVHLTDWLTTQRMQTNAAGAAEEECYSYPFGDGLTCTPSGADATEQHFMSKMLDAESGLDYFGARYLSSDLGRFMTPDFNNIPEDGPEPVPYAVLRDPRSLNLYAFVENNPNLWIDIDGHVGGGASSDDVVQGMALEGANAEGQGISMGLQSGPISAAGFEAGNPADGWSTSGSSGNAPLIVLNVYASAYGGMDYYAGQSSELIRSIWKDFLDGLKKHQKELAEEAWKAILEKGSKMGSKLGPYILRFHENLNRLYNNISKYVSDPTHEDPTQSIRQWKEGLDPLLKSLPMPKVPGLN